MPQSYIVDVSKTWESAIYITCEPRMVFVEGKATQEQERTKEGLRRWTLSVAVTPREGEFRKRPEILQIGVANQEDPSISLQIGSPVDLLGFEVGLMNGQPWHRAEAVVPLGAKVAKQG